jgi:hypothetical protein
MRTTRAFLCLLGNQLPSLLVGDTRILPVVVSVTWMLYGLPSMKTISQLFPTQHGRSCPTYKIVVPSAVAATGECRRKAAGNRGLLT